jgi:hypothetical protein
MRIYQLLFEAEEEDIPEKNSLSVKATKKLRLSKDSLDDQIDSFLIKFETESVLDEEEQLSESFLNKNLKYLIYEKDDITGSEDKNIEDSELDDMPMMNLNIDSFASKVARLIFNSHNLLDLETAIVNRAIDFLNTYYNEDYAERFIEILDNQFSIEVKSNFRGYDSMPAEHDAPQGLGAYDGGSGGGG